MLIHRAPLLSLVAVALAAALLACGETVITVETRRTPSPGVDLDDGLLAYWPFDETEAGTTVVDASGHGHDGTPSPNPPAPSLSVPPVGFSNERSLSFDGVEQLVDIGNPERLDVSGNVTLSAWIRPAALDGFRNIVAHGFRNTPNRELALRIVDAEFQFTAWNSADHMASAPVPTGDVDNWHHLAGVYDGGRYLLYRDGELVAEQEDEYAPAALESPWALGGRAETTPAEGRYFSGFIDDVRIYGRALSGDEVRALFRR
jgi:hypothetical protein